MKLSLEIPTHAVTHVTTTNQLSMYISYLTQNKILDINQDYDDTTVYEKLRNKLAHKSQFFYYYTIIYFSKIYFQTEAKTHWKANISNYF